MSFSSTSVARKARRREEREQKKQKKRAAHNNNNNNKKNTAASVVDDNKKAAAEVAPPQKRKSSESNKPERSPGKKAKRSSSSNTSPAAAVSSYTLQDHSRDPYSNLPPEVAAAMRRDDDEIADLEVKLGLSQHGRDRLNSEYAKKECFGEDFGSFLSGLDDLCKQILTSPPQEYSEDEGSCSSEYTSESESIEKSATE